jgi:hypothetical protein
MDSSHPLLAPSTSCPAGQAGSTGRWTAPQIDTALDGVRIDPFEFLGGKVQIVERGDVLLELEHHRTKKAMPPEIRRLGRTMKQWFDKIANFHLARVSNGPTEALNNLIRCIKRVCFRNFENYRIPALPYASKPNWGACSDPSSSGEQADPNRFRWSGWSRETGDGERATGIEPAFSAWEADVLPLNYARESHANLHAGQIPTAGGRGLRRL